MKSVICLVAVAMMALTVGCASDTEPTETPEGEDVTSESESGLTRTQCVPYGASCTVNPVCCTGYTCKSISGTTKLCLK
jgi:hypothetical protein